MKEYKTKIMKHHSNSVSHDGGIITRDEWLSKVIAICMDKYDIDEEDIRRFVRLYEGSRRKHR